MKQEQQQKNNPKHSCSICLSDLQNISLGEVTLPCCHSFHTGCFDTWLRKKNICPLCRYSLNGECLLSYKIYCHMYLTTRGFDKRAADIAASITDSKQTWWQCTLSDIFFCFICVITVGVVWIQKYVSGCRDSVDRRHRRCVRQHG